MHEAIRILHLSDTHAFADETRHYDRVDTAAQLRRVLGAVSPSRRFDLIVCSGDVSEDGTAGSYERLRAVVSAFARDRGARTVYAMGNHDRRGPFRDVLGSGQPDAASAGTPVSEPEGHGSEDDAAERPVASSATVDGLRTIVLDSSIPGRGYGVIDDGQLAFLREQLAAPAPRGTVVVVHHPPVPAQTDLLQALALQNPDALIDAVAGTDVHVVLSGHYHHPLFQLVRGVPVAVAPGVANASEAAGDPAEEAATFDAGAAIVEIGADGVRVVPFTVPLRGDDVFRYDADRVREIARIAGPPQP